MKDYVDVAGQLGVSHVLGISQTESNVLLRLAKTPTGPTIHFRVVQYSLSRLVRNSQKHPYESSKVFQHAPLVVLNGFGVSEHAHVKLQRAAFQNMFPTVNVDTIKLSECRRVVLFHVNKADETVELRHYAIKATPVGLTRSVKKLVGAKSLPDLSKFEDVSEFLTGNSGAASDSENEDETAKVELSDQYTGRGNVKSQKCSMVR
jgi:ribosome biogenesis protein SSF1/2